jgi:hypothetical protein
MIERACRARAPHAGVALPRARQIAQALALATLVAASAGCQRENRAPAPAASDTQQSTAQAQPNPAATAQSATLTPPAPAPAAAEQPAAAAGSGAVRPNKPPKAKFEIFPLQGYAYLTSLTLNSSTSTDDFDLGQELRRRWDFTGDGEFDTGFLHSDVVQWTYKGVGRFSPKLVVMDSGGLSDTCVGPEIEILSPCPAPDFALEDVNPNSPTKGKTYRLADFRDRQLVVWFAAPTH